MATTTTANTWIALDMQPTHVLGWDLDLRRRLRSTGRLTLKTPEIDHQIVGGLVSVVAVLFERLVDDSLEFLRSRRVCQVGGLGLAAQNLGDNGGCGVARESAAPGRHLVRTAPKEKISLRASTSFSCACSGDM